jgi:hypothetical protein
MLLPLLQGGGVVRIAELHTRVPTLVGVGEPQIKRVLGDIGRYDRSARGYVKK